MDECPVTASFLMPKDRRYVDPEAPRLARLMAAKAMIPSPPAHVAHMLFMLTFDPDAQVREQALATAQSERSMVLLSQALQGPALELPVAEFCRWMLALPRA